MGSQQPPCIYNEIKNNDRRTVREWEWEREINRNIDRRNKMNILSTWI